MGLSFVGSTILLMGCAHLARYSQARRRSMQRIPAARRSRTPTRRRAVQPRPRSKPAPQPFLSVMPGGELQLAIMTSTPAGAAVKPPEAESGQSAAESAEAPVPSAQPPPPQPDVESGDGGQVPAASEESHVPEAGTGPAADIETGHGQHPSELT